MLATVKYFGGRIVFNDAFSSVCKLNASCLNCFLSSFTASIIRNVHAICALAQAKHELQACKFIYTKTAK